MRTFAIIATAGFASAASTPDWINGSGYGCASYAKRWCAHGAFRKGSEWTGGAKYNYPEKNCEVCGKQGGGDSSEWSNGHGFDCAQYEKSWCFAGDFKAGEEWTGGAKYNFPELNCATCGKDSGTHYKGKDSHSWHNAKGHNCASYLKSGWCAGGKAVPGMEWTLGATYNFPEKNCVICGKDAEFLKGSDMPGFTNNHNHGCGSYKAKGWCANGKAIPGQEWTLGAKYNFPELNCMDCGKDNVVGQDILNFQNGAGHGCSSYAKSWCKDGKAIVGQEWTLGAKYNFPEKNCVVCGKDYVAPTAAPVVVKKKVATTTAAPCPQVKCANPAPCSYVPSALLNADGCPMHPCGIRTCKTVCSHTKCIFIELPHKVGEQVITIMQVTHNNKENMCSRHETVSKGKYIAHASQMHCAKVNDKTHADYGKCKCHKLGFHPNGAPVNNPAGSFAGSAVVHGDGTKAGQGRITEAEYNTALSSHQQNGYTVDASTRDGTDYAAHDGRVHS